MSMRRSLGALLGACALSVSLVACGSGGGGSATPDLGELRDEFVGTWELVSMESESTTLSEEDVDELAEKGTLVTLDLDEDGNLIYNETGNQQEGSWSVKDEGALTLKIGDATVEAPFENEQLTVESGGSSMVFEKTSDVPDMDRQPEDNVGDVADDKDDKDEKDPDGPDDPGIDDGTLDELAERFTDEAILGQDLYAMGVEKTADLDVTLSEDDVARVAVTGIGVDYEGDTGYMLSIENRTDQDFYVENVMTVLDGTDVYEYATVARVVRAGDTADAFLFFDSDVCSVTEDSSCYVMLGFMDIDGNIVGACEGEI
ncbi:hypothetical protein H6A07_06745 [Olsenella uli]|uniref:hypothetical protein n=1 Tax=Olsenella uli TaxID=133926 RepID=UPI00195C24ED|nr:hypothetical protein [Olsenella uli]MBM6676439.1 hypothetical protein [Olsenella uli]